MKKKERKKEKSFLHPSINHHTKPFSGWYLTEVASVLTMLFSYHLLFWMNERNPPFYNICFLLWRGAAVEGRHVKVTVWFSFFFPLTLPLSLLTLGMSRLTTSLSDALQSGFVGPFLDIHEIVLLPPAVKDTSDWGLGSQVQCNLA